jgi:hypothetical protein
MGIRSDGATCGKDDSYHQSQGLQLLIEPRFGKEIFPGAWVNALRYMAYIKHHKILRQPAAVLPINPNKVDRHGWMAVSCVAYFQNLEILDNLTICAGKASLGSTKMLLPSKWGESERFVVWGEWTVFSIR